MSEEKKERDDHSSEEKGFVPPKPPTPNPNDPSSGEDSPGSGGSSGESQAESEPKEGSTARPDEGGR